MSSFSRPDPPRPLPAKLLEWTPDYSVFIDEIDAEHQSLFGMINTLHTAMLNGHGIDVLARLLEELSLYVNNHFAHEEALMAASRYPGREAHIQQHDALHRRAKTLIERFDRGEITMTIELTLLLSEWLRKHTMTTDRRFGEYLRDHHIAFTGYGRNIEIAATPAAPAATHDGAVSSVTPPSA